MIRIFTYCLILLTNTFGFVYAQNSFKPHSISANVNTTYHEVNPVISPDGKTVYFQRINHPQNKYGENGSQDVWYSVKQDDGTWSPSKRVEASFNNGRNNAILSITQNGENFLVSGIYTKKSAIWRKRGVSMVTRVNDSTWTDPVRVKVPRIHRKNKGLSSNTFINNTEDVIFFSYTKKWEGTRLMLKVSTQNDKGKWKKPKKISKNIRKEFKAVEAPFLSSNGEVLYFSGYKKGKENKGKYDLWECEKLDETYRNWGNPSALSDTINTHMWESYLRTDQEGEWATFASDRNPGNKSDIYIVKLRENNPYIELSGIVKNGDEDTPIGSDIQFEIYSGDEVIDTVTIDYETSSYSIKLPLGKRYELKAVAENYRSQTEVIDLENVEEHQVKKQDLMLYPIPYVLVRGKLVDTKTNELIPAEANARIAINNQIADTISTAGSLYDIKLELGEVYTLQIVANQYEAEKVVIDLSGTKTYKEIDQDLRATPFALFAVLTGKILDKETNELITENVFVDVNDEHKINSKITDGIYYVELPLGKEYNISASAKKYFPIYEIIDLKDEKGNLKIQKDLYLAPIKVGVHVRINNIFFEHNSFILKPESYHDLDKLSDLLKDYDKMKIEIGGHTDSWGSNSLNQKLSEDRAKSVREYLVGKGVNEERITYKGYGESTPVATNKTEAGRAENRRVEFIILEQ